MPSPIRLSEHVYALPIEATTMMGTGVLNLALILDAQYGATLVDTGTPNQLPAIEAALGELGLKVGDLKRVIVTHHDLDHIGSLEAVVAASGAEVLTSEAEVPYVQEGRRAQKMPPADRVDELMAEYPEHVREMVKNLPAVQVPVSRLLHDGEVLDIAGGVRVVFTPGHTVGHLSLFMEQDGVLITGDAMSSSEGQLGGPPPQATADMPEAMRSVQKLAQLPVKTVLTYHGGVVDRDAALQLARVAGDANI
ncbi:MBL fold metallo-hydrolase [Deinococcus sp.]|uniref:MBL fold metallo-hydrolase n=1 Tax=Deinococcus sp. TaxID=47478 RepID=UPI003C7AEB0A